MSLRSPDPGSPTTSTAERQAWTLTLALQADVITQALARDVPGFGRPERAARDELSGVSQAPGYEFTRYGWCVPALLRS